MTLSNVTARSPGGANQRPNSRFCWTLEMREQLGVLEHEPDTTPMTGDEDPGLRVDQNPIVERDTAAIGSA